MTIITRSTEASGQTFTPAPSNHSTNTSSNLAMNPDYSSGKADNESHNTASSSMPVGGMATAMLHSENLNASPPNHLSIKPMNDISMAQGQNRIHGVNGPVSSQAASSAGRVEMSNFVEEDNEDSDADVDGSQREKRAGRRKILIQYIDDKSRRHITFSKRKAGIMKKAYELSTLTGTQVLLLVASETGHVYTFATPKLQPLITKPEGKNLIQACLNAPDGNGPDYSGANPHVGYDEDGGKDSAYQDRHVSGTSQSNLQAANYAAAMAGLAGFPYPGAQQSTAQGAPYMNPAHYPAYAAAQYNAAMAAGYWPGHGGSLPSMPSQGNIQPGTDRTANPHMNTNDNISNQQ